MRLVIVFLIVLISANAEIVNFEHSITIQKNETLNLIEEKEKEVMEAAKKYKKVLEDKRDAMILLLRELKAAEIVAKANQIKRKRIILQWEKYSSSSSNYKESK